MNEALINDTADFGMFTERGNRVVHGITVAALELGWTWPEVYDILCDIATIQGLEEATDTMVRELVYDRCRFTTDFYI